MPTTTRERVFPLVPGLLLAAVATWQIHLTRTEHLSPWKGGGFGMFSTADLEANRHIRVYLRRGSAAFAADLPPSLGRLASHVRLYPTEERLRELGRLVAAENEDALGPFTGVRVEVWRTRFEAELAPRPALLRQLELDWTPEPPPDG